jgi:hypothetical protein
MPQKSGWNGMVNKFVVIFSCIRYKTINPIKLLFSECFGFQSDTNYRMASTFTARLRHSLHGFDVHRTALMSTARIWCPPHHFSIPYMTSLSLVPLLTDTFLHRAKFIDMSNLQTCTLTTWTTFSITQTNHHTHPPTFLSRSPTFYHLFPPSHRSYSLGDLCCSLPSTVVEDPVHLAHGYSSHHFFISTWSLLPDTHHVCWCITESFWVGVLLLSFTGILMQMSKYTNVISL